MFGKKYLEFLYDHAEATNDLSILLSVIHYVAAYD